MAFAPAQRPVATKRASRDLTDVLHAALMVFVPAIAAVADVVVVINQVHTVVQITEERVQLRKTALHSAESACVISVIKPIVPISLIVIAPSFLRVTTLTQKGTKLNRSRLIVGDAISAKSSRLRCTQCIDKKQKMPAFIGCAFRSVKRPLRIAIAKAHPW